MQKTHADEAASSGKHDLLQWLHDTGHGIFPDRKSRLGAVSHTHPEAHNGNGSRFWRTAVLSARRKVSA